LPGFLWILLTLRGSGRQNHAACQEIEACPSIALALDELEPVDLTFGLASTPGLRPTPWRYSEAGLVTPDLVPLDEAPRPLFDALDREQSGALMAAMDACNSRFGRVVMVPGRAGLVEKHTESTKFEMRSPRFTTRLSDAPRVSAAAL
jgi:hypothetical protein